MWFDGWLRELEDLAYNVAFFWAALRHGAADPARRDLPAPHGVQLRRRRPRRGCCGVPLVLEFNSSELWKGRYWGGLRPGARRGAGRTHQPARRRPGRRRLRVLRDQLVQRACRPRRCWSIRTPSTPTSSARTSTARCGARAPRARSVETIVVGFSGTFGLWHGIPTLAAALSERARRAASGALAADRRRAAAAAGRRRRQPRDSAIASACPGWCRTPRCPAYLAACDILVSPHGRQADGGEFFGSPTKLFEYMAAGRPIVASAVGQIADVLEDERSALLVPPDDVEALCRTRSCGWSTTPACGRGSADERDSPGGRRTPHLAAERRAPASVVLEQ